MLRAPAIAIVAAFFGVVLPVAASAAADAATPARTLQGLAAALTEPAASALKTVLLPPQTTTLTYGDAQAAYTVALQAALPPRLHAVRVDGTGRRKAMAMPASAYDAAAATALIERAAASVVAAITACYDRALLAAAPAAATLALRLQLGADGATRSATIVADSLRSSVVDACALRAAARLQTARVLGAPVVVELPIRLTRLTVE